VDDDGMNCGGKGYGTNKTSHQKHRQSYHNDRNIESSKNGDGNGSRYPTKCTTSQQELPQSYCNEKKGDDNMIGVIEECYVQLITKILEGCFTQQGPQCTRSKDIIHNDGANCRGKDYKANITSPQLHLQSYCNDRNIESTKSNNSNGCEHPKKCAKEVQCKPPTCIKQCNANNLSQYNQCNQCKQYNACNHPQSSKILLDYFAKAKIECKKQSRLKPRILQYQRPTRSCKVQNTLEAIIQTLICRKCPDIRCCKPLKLVNNWHLGICGSPKCRRSLKPINNLLGIDNLEKAMFYMDNGNAMKKATEMNFSDWSTEDLQKAIRNIDNQNARNVHNIQLGSIRNQLSTLRNWSTEELQKKLQDIDNGNAIKEIAYKYHVLLGLLNDYYIENKTK
jgi:hypothetical protein